MTHDDMQDDVRLNALARNLGAHAAERLDVAATARAVVQRLRAEPTATRRPWMQVAWLRIAAAIVVVIGAGFAVRQTWWGGNGSPAAVTSPAHGTHLIADDLQDLSPDELRTVLASFDDIVTSDTAGVPEPVPDLRQLDARQLRAVLRSLEG
jgi:hypothetical protein